MGIKRQLEADTGGEANGDSNGVHPSRKRRIEYTEMDARLAPLYNNLSDEVKSVRLKAAAELIRNLSNANGTIFDRALTRLVRGLCSSRKASRLGFFMTLTEVLRSAPNVKTESNSDVDLSIAAILDKIEKLSEPDSKSSGQERRDYLLGRCVAFKSVIQSNVLFQPNVSISEWNTLLDHVFRLASENSWLRKECGLVLHESLFVISQVKDLDFQYPSALMSKLHSYNFTKTPEGVAIWLTVSELFPSANLPKGIWHHNDPLSSKDRPILAKILRDNGSPEAAEGSIAVTGKGVSPQTTPNFAWKTALLALYKRVKESSKGKTSDFEKFWIDVVDNSLFSSTASVERKALGLQILSTAVETVPSALIGYVFAPNIMRCIINQRAETDRYLHESAKLPLTSLVSRAKIDVSIVPLAIEAFISGNGSVIFDQITKTKTVEELLSRADPSAAESVLDTIQRLVRQPHDQNADQVDSERRALANMLLVFTRKQHLTAVGGDSKNNFPWEKLFNIFVEAGYITQASGRDTPSPPYSKEIQEIFRSRTMSCLTHILSAKLDTEFAIPSYLVSAIQDRGSKSGSKMVLSADPAVTATMSTAISAMKKLGARETSAKVAQVGPIRAMKLLYSLCILQVHNGDEDAVSVLDDLQMFQTSSKKTDDASSMLIEILLSFISKPSAIFKKLAEQVFGAFASQLTEDGLLSMLDILEKKENLTGQQELFDQADDAADDAEEDEDEDDESIDGEDASDVEMFDGSVEESEDAEESDDDDGSSTSEISEQGSDSEEADEDAEDAEASAFEAKLARALGTSKAQSDDGSSSDESDMDDEQMMALDGHLTTIFKERSKVSNKKKDNKDAKETIINFKNRVLDLLLIYVKQEHGNRLALDLILPTLILIRTTTSKQTSEKAFGLIRQLSESCNKSKAFPVPEDAEEALEILRGAHQEARLNTSKLHGNACSRSSLFIAKVLTTANAAHYGTIADLYTILQKEWYTDPKSNIQPSIFTEWTSWSIATKKR